MFQRQQTLWLLLAALSAALGFQFPFVTGEVAGKTNYYALTASSNFWLLLVTLISIIISVVTVFLFKDRKLQMRLCLLGLLFAIAVIALYIMQMGKLTKSTLALFSILPFLNLFSVFMAYRNIRKDEKLVRSLDKLR